MRIEDYFASLSQELQALRDRVRYMIEDQHWPTDGEWKESVLRSVIRRSAPTTHSVGRGFVVNEQDCSTQIDILIHDNSHPVLYRDGDLVFISPAACRAVIEVKSKVNRANFQDAAEKLAATAELVRRSPGGSRTFIGLFGYESAVKEDAALDILEKTANGEERRVIDHLALGASDFIKYWTTSPEKPRRIHKSWHYYGLHGMAAGYFIHNLLMHLSPDAELESSGLWFPEQSKEFRLHQARRLCGA